MNSWPIRSSSSLVTPGRTWLPTSMSASAATWPAMRIASISSGVRMALLAREDGSPEAAYSGRGTPARTLRMGDTRPGVTGGDGGSGSALRRLRLPMGNRV